MGYRSELPPSMQDAPFDQAAVERARLPKSRAYRRDVRRIYPGVHSTRIPEGLRERCEAYAVRLRPGQFFSHATAALLHGMPLPSRLEAIEPLHVGAVRPAQAPRVERVVGHRFAVEPAVQALGGVPVCVPSEVWCQLAPVLSLDEAIEVADHLLTVSPLGSERTRALLTARIDAFPRPAAAMLRAALVEARSPVLSPGETRVRLLLVRAGIREPELNVQVEHDHVVLGRPDLVWRRERVAVEYEGDGHRAEKLRWRKDIDRYAEFEDAGWSIVRVTADDLDGVGRRTQLVRRVARRLAARS